MVLSLNIQLGEYHSMSCENTKISRPAFSSRNGRGIYDECVVVHDIGGGGLEVLNVRSMPKLGLSIAAKNLEILCGFEPNSLLPFGSHHFDALKKHGGVETQWKLLCIFENVAQLVNIDSFLSVGHVFRTLLDGPLDHIDSAFIEKVEIERMRIAILILLHLGSTLRSIDEVPEGLHINLAVESFVL